MKSGWLGEEAHAAQAADPPPPRPMNAHLEAPRALLGAHALMVSSIARSTVFRSVEGVEDFLRDQASIPKIGESAVERSRLALVYIEAAANRLAEQRCGDDAAVRMQIKKPEPQSLSKQAPVEERGSAVSHPDALPDGGPGPQR